MAPRLDHGENIVFLFKCIESSGIKVDFQKVSTALGIKRDAGRKRYVRLRQTVQSSLDNANGVNVDGPKTAPSIPKPKIGRSAGKKRKMAADVGEDAGESDNDYNFVAGSIESQGNQQAKRQTRGVKLDFTTVLAYLSSQSRSEVQQESDNNSDDQSEYLEGKPNVSDNKAAKELKQATTPSKTVEATEKALVTPPSSKRSTRLVSAWSNSAPDLEALKKQDVATTYTRKLNPLLASATPPKTPQYDDGAIGSLPATPKSPLAYMTRFEAKQAHQHDSMNNEASPHPHSIIRAADRNCPATPPALDPQGTLSVLNPRKKLPKTMYKRRKTQHSSTSTSQKRAQSPTPEPIVANPGPVADGVEASDQASSLMTHNGIFPRFDANNENSSKLGTNDVVYPDDSISVVQCTNKVKNTHKSIVGDRQSKIPKDDRVETGETMANPSPSILRRFSSFWR